MPSRWAKADPLGVLEYVNQTPNGERGRETILSTWAGHDPAAAKRWALANPEGDGPNPHLAAVIAGVAEQCDGSAQAGGPSRSGAGCHRPMSSQDITLIRGFRNFPALPAAGIASEIPHADL